MTRSLLPGSDWLYAKLYTGRLTADRILVDAIAPTMTELATRGALRTWFFVRYQDAEGWHLRIRVDRGGDDSLGDIWGKLSRALAQPLRNGAVWRVQLDTYEREVERYGGPNAIRFAETFFHADSKAVADLLATLAPRTNSLSRRELAVAGTNALLADFQLSLEDRRSLVRAAARSLCAHWALPTDVLHARRRWFRQSRDRLTTLLSPELTSDPCVVAIRRRSEESAGTLQSWRRAVVDFDRWESIVASCTHMFLNRLFASDHADNELQTLVTLDQLYTSALARTSRK